MNRVLLILTGLFLTYNCFSLNEVSRTFIDSGKAAFLKGEHDKSFNDFNEAIGNADRSTSELAETYYQIGRFYADQSIDDLALKYYFIALEDSEKKGNRLLSQEILNYIGGSYYNRLYYLEAKKYWGKSLEINEVIGNEKGLSSNLNNLGEVEFISGNYDASLELYRRAAKLKSSSRDSVGLCTVLTNLAMTELYLGRPDSVLIYLDSALQLALNIGNDHLFQYIDRVYGKYYHNIGDVNQAIKWYHKALSIDKTHPNPDFTLRKFIYNELFEIHKESGNLDSTLIYQLKLNKIESDLLKKEKEILQTSAEMNSLMTYKNNEIEELKRKSRQNRLVTYISLGALLVVISLVVIIIRQRERVIRSKNNSLLREKQLLDMKSRFISAASHQFRTPLTAIQSGLATLEMQKDSMPDEFRARFERVVVRTKESIRKMVTLIDNVLLFGEINEGGIDRTKSEIHLREFCESVVNEVKVNHSDKDVTLVLKDDPIVRLNEELLRLSVSNLLDNALTYTSSGSKNPEMEVTFEGDDLCFIFRDFGIGIPENDVPHIFEPFYRGSNSREIIGAGLGLAIAKECVILLNGIVGVKSILGEGTTIQLNIKIE